MAHSSSGTNRWSRVVAVVGVLGLVVAFGWRVVGLDPAPPPTLSVESGIEPAPIARPVERRRFRDSEPVGEAFPRMVDAGGAIRQPLSDSRSAAAAFVFLSTTCPISNGYLPELNRLHDAFGERGVEFHGIVADSHATAAEVAEHSREYGIRFPVLRDTAGVLRKRLRPTHTPHAIVVARSGAVVYRGRIDDRYRDLARPRPAAERHDLQIALEEFLAGETPTVAETKPVGCLLESLDRPAERGDVTFCRDVAPIVFANCTRCHRPGEATPFPLRTYEEVRRHAAQIVDVVERRIMPPWKPVPNFGHFRNEQRLRDEEIATIRAWVAGGTPEGDPADRPPLPTFPEGWQLGEPDLVLEMPAEFEIPADGPDLYQHFVLPTGLTEDRLVAAFEFRPGNPRVVHHSWVYLDTRGNARRRDAADPGPGFENFGGPGFVPTGNLGGWGPGGTPRRLPDGMGRPMLAGSDVVLQIHYHPTGKVERDRSRIGLYFAEPDAEQLVTELVVADVDLEIPAGAEHHEFRASYTLPVDTTLLDASPHMHLLGRAMTVTARTPAGETVPLIRIDDWNFYWQDHYVFARPVRLPAGTRVEFVAVFDNSENNPHNPHSPPRTTYFGEFSDDEMAVCYFQATCDRREDVVTLADHAGRFFGELVERYEADKARRNATRSETTFTNSLGMSFVRIPPGEFTMGRGDTDRFGRYSACEGPPRRVRIDNPPLFGRHEVTVGRFRAFVAATGYRTEAERDGRGCNTFDPETGRVVRDPQRIWTSPGFPQTDRHPVVCVSHGDAVAFCAWLSETEGRTYRLPTEAEWEYACRAGTDTLFSTGEDVASLEGSANVADDALGRTIGIAAKALAPWNDGHAFTAPVGAFRPNAFGLCDLHGNVGEWCADWFTPRYGEPVDPNRKWRIVRSGSWFNTPTSTRSTGRHDGVPTDRSTTNGFRVVLEAE